MLVDYVIIVNLLCIIIFICGGKTIMFHTNKVLLFTFAIYMKNCKYFCKDIVQKNCKYSSPLNVSFCQPDE